MTEAILKLHRVAYIAGFALYAMAGFSLTFSVPRMITYINFSDGYHTGRFIFEVFISLYVPFLAVVFAYQLRKAASGVGPIPSVKAQVLATLPTPSQPAADFPNQPSHNRP